MASRLGNIAALFKEGRTRTIILVTVIILLVAVGVGVYSMRGKKGLEASAGVTSAPGGIQSIPFSAPNKAYEKLQEQQNVQQAKQAEQAGGSAIPTIVNSGKDVNVTPTGDVGVGFTALNREQSDAGTFEAKSLGNKQCPPMVTPEKSNNLGTPIYDKNGRLIGYAGSDGKIRDLSGKIIGVVGPDGVARDLSGNIIGQVGKASAGTPVYDENGNLMGYVGEDGKVRDANGRVVGTVGPDGKVRDITGAVLGSLGVPVYDKDGKLIGFAGPDGKVRDASGKIIGSVGSDGVVRDLNGNIIGKAGAISPGSPVYDANGNLIGNVGPDGFVRDASGNIVGKIGLDGKVRDVNGNIIGSVVKPEAVKPLETPAGNVVPTSVSQEQKEDALTEKQNAILKDQNLSRLMEQKQQAMSSQASQLLSAWISPSQQYVAGQEPTEKDDSALDSEKGVHVRIGGSGAKSDKSAGPVFIKAGTVFYGVISTAINSDEPGPVMATIINGDYKGGKLLGTMVNQGKAVLISFNVLTMPQFSKSISINAVAIDQNTARTALSTETDNHYLLRYGTLFAASFMQGYGQAVSSAGTVTNTGPLGNTTTVHSKLSGKEQFFSALGNVGAQFGNQMNAVYSTPPTVYVAPGTAVGILFMGDVTLPTS
jgi:YD repeat-containing protein